MTSYFWSENSKTRSLILSSGSLHFQMMLNAGKHVICEKPLGMNLKETRELIELARKQKLFLMEAIWSRCLPAYEKLKELLKKGKRQSTLSRVNLLLKI